MTTTTNEPINKDVLDNAQTEQANQAMDGIKPTDINQNNNTVGSDESLLDMLYEAKKQEDIDNKAI